MRWCWLRGHKWIGDMWRGWACERCDKEPKVCRNCFGQHDPTAFIVVCSVTRGGGAA